MKSRKLLKIFSLSTLMSTSPILFTTVACNQTVERFFFDVEAGDLKVTFCDRGASIYSIKYKNKFITYHPKDKNVFIKDDNYYGKTLGRIAGRVPDGKLNFGDKEYQLDVNEKTETKNNCLHGGTHSFAYNNFEHKVYEADGYYNVSFHYVSPPLEAGFPEAVDAWYVYTIYKETSKIDLNISATATGPTPLDLSIHPFFRLSETGDIKNHILKIPADYMAEYSDMFGPTNNQVVVGKKEVIGDYSPWDFRSGKPIGQDIEIAKAKDAISGGYDHIWVFNDTLDGLHTVSLSNPDNNLALNVTTDADAIIMYANCYPKENQIMNPGEQDKLYGAITIEPYKFFTKDSLATDLKIDKGEEFKRYMSFEIVEG